MPSPATQLPPLKHRTEHRTYLITGASSGLGLALATQLAAQAAQGGHPAHTCLILPMRDPPGAEAARARILAAGQVTLFTPALDLACLPQVRAFTRELGSLLSGRQLDGVLLNAGVQAAQQLHFTADGLERTFVVNHLAHHLLAHALLPCLAPGAVMGWTASGTHDPCEPSARLFGFRGARYRSLTALAEGRYERRAWTPRTQACRDAYASAKLCNIVSARAFASAHGQRAHFFAFDPGLMPGTGLAREQPAWMRQAWHRLLPALARVLPGASTPTRSAAVLLRLLTAAHAAPSRNGVYVDFRGQARQPSRLARMPWVEADLMQGSDALLHRLAGA